MSLRPALTTALALLTFVAAVAANPDARVPRQDETLRAFLKGGTPRRFEFGREGS